MALQDSHLVKYDATLGYRGYYKSYNLVQIYDAVEITKDIVAISGAAKDKLSCIEVINLTSNSLIL